MVIVGALWRLTRDPGTGSELLESAMLKARRVDMQCRGQRGFRQAGGLRVISLVVSDNPISCD